MLPLWDIMGVALGFGTALLGKKATMACTEAVEEVIIDHYQNQEKYLKGKDNNLAKVTRQFAEDEKDHMHQAKNYDTGNDFFHKAFKIGVKSLSKLAIKLSEKI